MTDGLADGIGHSAVARPLVWLLALGVIVAPVPALAEPPSEATAPAAEHGPERAQDVVGPEPKAHPRGHGMVVAGTTVTLGGVAAYILLGAGLGIGNGANQDLASLNRREDIEARRDVLRRGATGNRLAIAGGIMAAVAMAVGIPLIVIGRRRAVAATRSRTARTMALGVRGAGVFVRVRL
ncbi:MAG: hypothetical protein JKY37_30830 [Nannocystaceae bacterium]|nr:hypothetical protein [Nannocystaceae bacterium]